MKLASESRRSQRLRFSDYGQEPAKASNYIIHLRRIIREARRNGVIELIVVLYCRVSGPKQKRDGNLDHQVAYLRRRVKRLGRTYGIRIKVLGKPFGEDVSAWKLSKRDRPELVEAAKLAKTHSVVLVATHTSRFVRHEGGGPPTEVDFDKLGRLVGKVRLATVVHPDTHEDRRMDTKRGMKAKGAKPGPKKKPSRPKKRIYGLPWNQLPKAERLKFKRLVEEDASLGVLRRAMNRSRSTVQGWRDLI